MLARQFASAALLLCLGTVVPALAGSLKDAPAPEPSIAACAKFGGAYIGATAGVGRLSSHYQQLDIPAATDLLADAKPDGSGATVGGTIGYNWQRDCRVFGVEADYNWSGISATQEATVPAGEGPALTEAMTSRVSTFGTLRARYGFVRDHGLYYLTGGLAVAKVRYEYDLPGIFSWSDSARRWGWTLGVGGEWKINERLSVKTEAIYVDLRDRLATHSEEVVWRERFQDQFWVARVGLNVKLDRDTPAANPMK